MSATDRTTPANDPQNRLSAVEYGFWMFLAIAVGRVNQLIPGLSSIPLAKVAILVTAAAFIANRRPQPALSKQGRGIIWSGFGIACLAILLTPSSIWPGASVHFLIYDLPPLLVATLIACSMRRSLRSIRGTLQVLLFSGFVLSALAALHDSHGRAVDANTMYDPNDLAYVLVTVLPIGLAFLRLSNSWKSRLFYGLITAITVTGLLLTESRGGLLGFFSVAILLIFMPIKVAAPTDTTRNLRRFRTSFAVALLTVCVATVIWTQLPHRAQVRYMTLLHLNKNYNTNLHDKSGRESIWIAGLRAFAERPWGYGPHTYAMVDLDFGGNFHSAHNSFLLALVELGPLGLIFFSRMYLLTLGALRQTRLSALAHSPQSHDQIERAVLARALQFCIMGNLVSGFFLSQTYSVLLWVIFGLTAAISAVPPEADTRIINDAMTRHKPQTKLLSSTSMGSTLC